MPPAHMDKTTVAHASANSGSDPFHPANTFSLTAHARQLEDAMKGPKKPVAKPADLPAKPSGAVKGGGWTSNDNISLVRATARPATKR
jgi:hypothetical protein